MPEKEYIDRETLKILFAGACAECRDSCAEFDGIEADCNQCLLNGVIKDANSIPAADVRPVPPGGIGELSDGYHTFNGLYYQRMVLFAALVKVYRDKAWKSWRHEGGELCFGKDNYFIVGIDTPQGSYTYHYHGEHWDMFECEELPVAKHWDGHTEKDVTRLLSLDVRPVVLCRECRYAYDSVGGWCCSHGICVDCTVREDFFCADGARMDGDGDV